MKNRLLLHHAASFGTAALGAAAAFFLAPSWLTGMTRVVAAYDVAVLVLLAWYWWIALRTNAAGTKARATLEDPGRNVVLAVVLVAVAFGLAAAIDVLGAGPRKAIPGYEIETYAFALAAVILGWSLIHTIMLFRYARLYYGDRNADRKSDAGLIFPGKLPPNDLDFAYFSFVLGMTFQVSDVQIADPVIRRLALAHGLISFGYNTAILALGVNVVSNLLH